MKSSRALAMEGSFLSERKKKKVVSSKNYFKRKQAKVEMILRCLVLFFFLTFKREVSKRVLEKYCANEGSCKRNFQ